ncbi:GmrSD restriction endonuclease domain-containing protein [Streptomyces halstedii]|uniref:GmrSD restriction endonuclease domain-containing protein n=1 Tax=Streptomyces halstedii TaxID=1944 RepID=UPI00365E9CDC
MRITDLGPEGFTYNVLRKPDFQRETANWSPEKVAELVKSFLEGDLIPSIILWRSPISRNIFVIDGAHRLSSLISWVHDDYGDKHSSIRFFDNNIPAEQKRAAEATRKLINETVGSYNDLSLALRNPDTATNERLRLAQNLSAFAIDLQWVAGGAEKAESSFFRINQQATPIESTELDMIKARSKPNALAARAFIRAGTGHKYWSTFEDSAQAEIESIAKEVYDLIFKPGLEQSIRTSDLPVAGRGYSADSVKMIFELVNYVNGLQPEMWREEGSNKRSRKSVQPLADDENGEVTLSFMRAVKRASGRIAGNSPASMGLHPAVYFYSATGRFQPAAFLAAVTFIQELTKKRHLASFTKHRAEFEEFLVTHKYFLNQIVRRYGSMQRSTPPILLMYETIFASFRDGLTKSQIIERLQEQSALKSTIKVTDEEDQSQGRNFSAKTKNVLVLNATLDSAPRCNICNARLDLRSITIDHKVRKADGGTGVSDNGQLTHPYCNSGFKERRAVIGSD